ncbi:MAG: ankyrin repeat domain-containing protein [Alphaproteobacteria bacterium]
MDISNHIDVRQAFTVLHELSFYLRAEHPNLADYSRFSDFSATREFLLTHSFIEAPNDFYRNREGATLLFEDITENLRIFSADYIKKNPAISSPSTHPQVQQLRFMLRVAQEVLPELKEDAAKKSMFHHYLLQAFSQQARKASTCVVAEISTNPILHEILTIVQGYPDKQVTEDQYQWISAAIAENPALLRQKYQYTNGSANNILSAAVTKLTKQPYKDARPDKTLLDYKRLKQFIADILEQGASPDIMDGWNDSVLGVCAIYDMPDIAEVFREAGANIDILGRDGQTPLIRAVNAKKTQMYKFFLAHGANPLIGDDNNRNILHWMVLRNNPTQLFELWENADDICACLVEGRTSQLATPLRLLFDQTDPAPLLLKFLLVLGGNPWGEDINGRNPLEVTFYNKNISILSKTIDEYAAVMNPRHAAVAASEIIAHMAQKNTQEVILYDQFSSFFGCDHEFRQELNRHYQEITGDESRQEFDYEDLHDAYFVHGIKMMQKMGYDLNSKDIEGDTVLMLAVQHEKVMFSRALLWAGVDSKIANKKGQTPETVAIQKSYGMNPESSTAMNYNTIIADIRLAEAGQLKMPQRVQQILAWVEAHEFQMPETLKSPAIASIHHLGRQKKQKLAI